jgi:hypothetical protein
MLVRICFFWALAGVVAPGEPFRTVVAPVGPANPRNSEAAIIPLKDGTLLLGWTEFYAGSGADHGPARISGKRSQDAGRTWGEKYTLVENDGGCNVMEVNFLRLNDGRIALFYCQKNSESTDCRVMMRTSNDEGRTFGLPKQLSPDAKYTGLTNGRCIRLKSGRILLEAWEGGDSYCYLSDDDGQTWRESQRVKPGDGSWEPACIELKDGRVLMLMRTGLGGQYQSISADGGATWSTPAPSQLAGTAAPVSISRVPTTGDLLAIWNHNPGTADAQNRNRNPLTAAISRDEGKTWEQFRNIEDAPDDAWAYPAVTWVNQEALLTYFNYKGGHSLLLKILPASWFSPARESTPRLDQTQVIGTHNSYHVAPDVVADSLMRAVVPREADANAHTHRPLTEQLEELGVRQLELDLFLDPRGGLYAKPFALQAAQLQQKDVPAHDPAGKLKPPGIKILHSPDFEFRTTVYTFADAVTEVRAWSDKHPRHFPVFLLLELKSESFSPLTKPPTWDAAACVGLEQEILAVFPRERILTPDNVRGDQPTLRDAVIARGWPTVEATRGKVVFLLDNEGPIGSEYLQPSDRLAGRLLFVSVPRTHPAAAWMKRNDPLGSFDEIQSLVKAGFLVRTRADAGTVEARANEVIRRDRAFASGAQLVSTDYPEPDLRFSPYAVRFEAGVVVRANPVTGPAGRAGQDLESWPAPSDTLVPATRP